MQKQTWILKLSLASFSENKMDFKKTFICQRILPPPLQSARILKWRQTLCLVWFLGGFLENNRVLLRRRCPDLHGEKTSLLLRTASQEEYSKQLVEKCKGWRQQLRGTYIDDGICLDVVHVGVAEPQLLPPALRGADNARGHRVLEGKGTPNGHHKLPWPQVCRLT